MRIVTWNCRRGPLDRKLAALEPLGADLAILSEAPRPSGVDQGVAWFGSKKLGVAVVARPPFRLDPLPQADVPCVYPITVSGPERFTLLAVWTWAAPTYRRALLNGLMAYQHLPKPWVVAGDFNGNVAFDPPRRRLKWRHAFEWLEEAGLVSAYHVVTGAAAGDEPHATYYFRTHRDKPFHIDYCYVPANWAPRLESVQVAPFDEFEMLSDHRPISITVRTS